MKTTFYVSEDHRTNEMCFISGGFDIKIIFKSGNSRIYRNVHYPVNFFTKAKLNNVNVVDFKNLGKTKNDVYEKTK